MRSSDTFLLATILRVAPKPDSGEWTRSKPNPLLVKALYEAAFAAASSDPFQVVLTASGIEISGPINSAERADELVRTLIALKPLLPAVGQLARSNSATAQAATSASVPFMITIGQKVKLKALGYSEDCIRAMTPREAHDRLKRAG